MSALEKTKVAVLEAVMFKYPDAMKPLILYTVSSTNAVEGILTQEGKAVSCFYYILSLA